MPLLIKHAWEGRHELKHSFHNHLQIVNVCVQPFVSLYILPGTSVGLTSCISIVFQFEKKDLYDHSAACCVTLS